MAQTQTTLIVAIDCPNTFTTQLSRAVAEVEGVWAKFGPQAMKLTDTDYTVSESVKRFSDIGISAISVFGTRATETAVTTALKIKSSMKIWSVLALTDDPVIPDDFHIRLKVINASRRLWPNGFICPADYVESISRPYSGVPSTLDIVVPGVSLTREERSGHRSMVEAHELPKMGATHAVVGRPIWQSWGSEWVPRIRQLVEALKG